MRIFALETDTEKFKKRFLYEDEREVMTIYYHWFKFFVSILRLALLSLALLGVAAFLWYIGLSWAMATGAFWLAWFLLVLPSLFKALLDWRYDFTFITTDKVVLADQSSLFRQRITPINLENFASVSTETQLANLFPFGKLRFHLKSGLGEDLILSYIPHADEVAAKIANAVTVFQRRKDLRRYSAGGHETASVRG